MKVITAPLDYIKKENEITCFLAGGITNCWEWQDEVIKTLNNINLPNLVVFNPRQKFFDIKNPDAADDQIKWEFQYLQQMDIFSMYFCGNTVSDQPICFYELGRYLQKMIDKYPNINDHFLVTMESDFKRYKDVIVQTNLAVRSLNKYSNRVFVEEIGLEDDRKLSAQRHARRIASMYTQLSLNNRLGI